MPRVNSGRQRTLSPSFFTDERVMAVPWFARFIFQGLWTIADREGRLVELHPLTLKARFLPADDVDAGAGLDALVRVGLVLRYEVEGQRYLWLPGFRVNQNPHPKEVRSALPPHPSDVVEDAKVDPKPHAWPVRTTQEVMIEASAGRDLRDPSGSSGPSDELPPSTSPAADAPAPVDDGPDPAALLRELWRATNPDLPQWQGALNKQRRNLCRRALERRPLDEWGAVFRRIHASDFLNSRGERASGWRASLDWALRPAGTKPEPAGQVLEGVHDNRTQRDFRKGSVRAEDVDWSLFKGKTGDVTDEF